MSTSHHPGVVFLSLQSAVENSSYETIYDTGCIV